VNVADFIMRSACEKAEQALSDQTHFVLDDKQWKAFMAALDQPPMTNPAYAACSQNHMSPSGGHERSPKSPTRNRKAAPGARSHSVLTAAMSPATMR
jgi:hypothetical protein